MTSTGNIKTTMRAWAINAYGEPMRLMELPVPQPKTSDVLIEMHGAEVGDWDAWVRDGGWPMERPFPLVLGLAGAGLVVAKARDVKKFVVGDAVYVYSYPLYDNGAWAEYMLVPESYAARPPATYKLAHAAAVPIVGLTTHETLVDLLKVQSGEVVLITAAAGGVGHLAVQIAAGLKAHVVATASRTNAEFVRGLGAELVIDYRDADFVHEIRNHYPNGVDKALNGVSGETANQVVQALRDGGQMIDLTGSVSVKRAGVRIEADYVVRADAARLKRLAQMIDEGQLKVEVQEYFPFERAPDALERVLAKRVRGKIALQILPR